MTAFIWNIQQLMVELKQSDLEKVVVKVVWHCFATNGEYSASASGFVPVEYLPEQPFTPFEDLTEEQVWQWVEPTLGKQMIEQGLESAIHAQAHPQYEYLRAPWE
jgi:hypothetical protein